MRALYKKRSEQTMKKIYKIFGIAVCIALGMAFTSFATAITNVNINCGPDDEQPFEYNAHTTMPLFTSDSYQYSLSYYYDTNEDSTTYRSERTYELVFYANQGYYFPDENQVNVNYSGISSVQRKKTESHDTFVVRVRAYPYYKWATPEITTKDIGNVSSIKWTGDASRYEVLMNWVDGNDTERSRKTTVSTESLSVSSYNRGDRDNRSYVTGIAVRAIGNAGNNSRTAPSDWATMGDIDVYNFDIVEYETWSDIGSGTSTGGSTGTGAVTGGSTAGPAVGGGVTIGWVQMGTDWYYRNASGAYSTGWVQDGADWYFCDSSGKMQSGWLFDGTHWYYLNTNHDGYFGRMLSGWQTIDGQVYYLNEQHDGTFGRMLTGWQNIGGVNYYFNEQHDGTFGRLITSI